MSTIFQLKRETERAKKYEFKKEHITKVKTEIKIIIMEISDSGHDRPGDLALNQQKL